ncbi:MAG: type II/IV secretion system protein [Fimbriimonadaceae bacterium]|nr:type II/IV secretion system protein [Fimbriimonadaceae bacterium]MCC7103133.1 type II/IV secretion system protein [Fimbriimonadaceae bacterium]
MTYNDSFNYGAGKKFRLVLREGGSARDMGGDEMSLAVGIVDNIFIQALEMGTSDIHLQPERDQLKIRFRQDGILIDGGQLPPEHAQNVIARLKLASGMRIDENRETQDGRIDMEFMGRRLSCRASCVPCLNGEKIVMRILDPGAMKVDLMKLGMPEGVLKNWQKAISVPYGLVLVTGPTGSGKTSTLYASLLTLDSKTRNIVTVEDPIEYEFDKDVGQVQVTEKLPFPRVMRSFLRQDPDVMMVGEMRDPESLGIGIQAALTGHLVLSTLHTNNSMETIGRMVDMGAEPYLIAGVTVAILAQRLIRLNCQKCMEPYKLTQDEIDMLKITPAELETAKCMKGKGCAECRGTGLRGRVGVFELLMGTLDFKHAIASGASYQAIDEAARKQGFRSMLEDGKYKVLNGWTVPDEVIRAVFTQAMA